MDPAAAAAVAANEAAIAANAALGLMEPTGNGVASAKEARASVH